MRTCQDHQVKKVDRDELSLKIRSFGFNATNTKLNILETLSQSSRPLSAQEIGEDLNCHESTIFRNLKNLKKTKLVKSVNLNEGFERFEFNDGRHHHHHIICRSCEQIRPIDHCLAKAYEDRLTQLGYQDITHTLEFSGICQACADLSKEGDI